MNREFRQEGHILICIPSLDHINAFLSISKEVKNVIVLTGDPSVQLFLEEVKMEKVYWIDSERHHLIFIKPVNHVYIFETSLAMTCLFVEILKGYLYAPITVLTKNKAYPKQLYSLLGVEQVIFSNSDNYSFLVK